jgi:hypothetical protein
VKVRRPTAVSGPLSPIRLNGQTASRPMFSLLCRAAVGWVESPIMVLPLASDAGVSSWVCVAVSVRGNAWSFGIAALS